MKKLRILPASVWKLFFVRARLRNKMKKKNTHTIFLDLNYDYFPIFHEERNDDKSPWKKSEYSINLIKEWCRWKKKKEKYYFPET